MANPLIDLLDEQLKTLESNGRLLLVLCVCYLVAGISVAALLTMIKAAAAVLSELKIPATLAGAGLTAFQYPAYVKSRERVAVLRRLKVEVVAAEQLAPEERQKVLDLAWQSVQQAIGK